MIERAREGENYDRESKGRREYMIERAREGENV